MKYKEEFERAAKIVNLDLTMGGDRYTSLETQQAYVWFDIGFGEGVAVELQKQIERLAERMAG